MLIRKYSHLKEIDQDNQEIIGIASSEEVDRDGEVVKQSGLDYKTFLNTNPVLIANHDSGDIRSVIGSVKEIWREGSKTLFKAKFSKANELARQAYEMVKEGVLNTFSIGFMAKKFNEEKAGQIDESELLEISLVPIPANPEAIVLAKGLKENSLAKKTIKIWEEQGLTEKKKEKEKEFTNEDLYNLLIKKLFKN